MTKVLGVSLRTRFLASTSSPAALDLFWTTGAKWIQMLFGLAGNVLSARALGPSEFGKFGLVIATVMVFGTLADAGLTYSAVKSIAQVGDREKARSAAGAYGLLRVASSIAVGLLGILLSFPIASYVLGYPRLTPQMQIAFCIVFSLGISSYPTTVLVGLGRFGRLALTGVLNAAITLSGIAILWSVGVLDLTSLLLWNVVLPVVSTLPAWFALPREWLYLSARKAGEFRPAARELLAFSKWIGLSLLASMIVSQGDLLLLGRLAAPSTVGVYAVALALATRFDTLNQSLFTVMMPRAVKLQSRGQIRQYAQRVLRGSLAMTAVIAALALLPQPLIILLYGERYAGSAGLFLVLLVVVLFDLVTSSLFLLAFPLNKPRLLAFSDWLRVAVLGVTGWALIPIYAVWGAVAARFTARFIGTTWMLLALKKEVVLREDEETALHNEGKSV